MRRNKAEQTGLFLFFSNLLPILLNSKPTYTDPAPTFVYTGSSIPAFFPTAQRPANLKQ